MVLCAALAGCATAPGTRDSGNNDPFEPINRIVFDANDAIDTAVIKPIAEAYRAVVPQFVRDRIRAFVDNLQEPRIFANNLLQLRINDAGFTFARFYVNSTLGLAGSVRHRERTRPAAGRPGTSAKRSTCGAWTAGRTWCCRCSGPRTFATLFGLGRRSLHDAAGAPSSRATRASGSTSASYAVSGFDLRVAQHRNARPDQGPRARLLRAIPQHRAAASRSAAARGARLADAPDELVDPGAPAQ